MKEIMRNSTKNHIKGLNTLFFEFVKAKKVKKSSK